MGPIRRVDGGLRRSADRPRAQDTVHGADPRLGPDTGSFREGDRVEDASWPEETLDTVGLEGECQVRMRRSGEVEQALPSTVPGDPGMIRGPKNRPDFSDLHAEDQRTETGTVGHRILQDGHPRWRASLCSRDAALLHESVCETLDGR